MRALDRLLLNPNVQRLGGIQALASAAVLGWGVVNGIDPLIAVGGLLCAANLALALFAFRPRAKHHKAPRAPNPAPAKSSPGGEEHRQTTSGRIYGGGAIGTAIRRQQDVREAEATFLAVEAEIALAHEEASALAKLLWDEWPYITPVGTDLEEAITDWRTKTTDFIAVVLGSGYRARFKTVNAGNDVLDRLESEGKFLGDLAVELTPEFVRADEGEILKARKERRANLSANFVEFEHYRAPGAPPKAPNQEAREFGRRDDSGELAKRCHMLAGSVERWAQRFKDQESATAERMVDEWVKAEPSVDRAEARRKGYTRNEKNWELDYTLKFGSEARTLFAEAYEMGEIAKEHERLATRPLANEFEQVPKLFNEIAESLYAAAEATSAP